MSKKKIAIVAGGNSDEWEVSLRSAAGLYAAMDKERYDVKIVSLIHSKWEVIDGEQRYNIDKNDFSYTAHGERHTFDYAYITIHGTPGEDGLLQGYFELIGMPYSTCSALVAGLSFNKHTCNQYLQSYGVRVAENITLRPGQTVDPRVVDEKIGYPCFVKSTIGGSSFGVTKVKHPEQLQAAIELAAQQGGEVMIEAFMQGTEITCGCYKTRTVSHVFPVTEVVPEDEFFDYDAKYNGRVSEITPARISPELTCEVQQLTSRIYDLLGCRGIVRIDYIITNGDKVNLLEMNITPGMTPTSFIPQQIRAAGLDIKEVLTDIIEDR